MPTIMRKRLASALLLLLSKATAATNDAPTTSIATIWAPMDLGADHHAIKFDSYASIVAVDATATTYNIDCIEAGRKPNFDIRPGCSDWETVSMTVGPSTAVFTAIVSQSLSGGGTDYGTVDETDAVDCVVAASTAVCESLKDGSMAKLMDVSIGWRPIDPISGTAFAGYYQTYTITGGLEKLSTTTVIPLIRSTVPVESGLSKETGGGTASGGDPRIGSGTLSGASSVVSGMGGTVVVAVLLGGWLV